MKVNVYKNNTPASFGTSRPHLSNSSGKQFGAWGIVKKHYAVDNSADVLLLNGVFMNCVPVASKEWVVNGDRRDPKKEFNSGERDLPPVGARVFVIMPSGLYDDCFIAPFSGFNAADENESATFLTEGMEKVKERITPGGWHITVEDDGRFEAVSPEKNTSIVIDADGSVTLSSGAITINAENVEITGGEFLVNGTAAPTEGEGAFCAIPKCVFSGAPHIGTTVSGT